MVGMSKITIIGHLGNDPELRFSQGQLPMCTLRVAVSERKKERDSFEDVTEWYNVICFGKTAENAHKYLKKGRQIYADGRLSVRKWTDKDGNNRLGLDITVNQLIYLGTNNKDDAMGTSMYPGKLKGGEEYLEEAPF